MKKLFLVFAMLAVAFATCAQKASDVIENGVAIKATHAVFLKFDGIQLLYHHGTAPNELMFKPFEDSVMLLPMDISLNFYIRPLNPLNFSASGENVEIIDPIDKAEASDFGAIVGLLGRQDVNTLQQKMNALYEGTAPQLCNIDALVAEYNALKQRIMVDQQDSVVAVFNSLKAIDFSTEHGTRGQLDNAETVISKLRLACNNLKIRIEGFKGLIEAIECDDAGYALIAKIVFTNALKDLQENWVRIHTRLTNLEKTYKIVDDVQVAAARNNWLLLLANVPAAKGKISLYTVTVSSTGFELSSDNEIVATVTKAAKKKVLRVRRFQRFVAEGSAGVAFTDLTFPKYGTTTDSLGVQHVAKAGNDFINKVNLSAMLNYVYFIPNSNIHPFWQIGIGANTSFPTLFTGVGMRMIVGSKRIALSTGFASTWIKTLDTLKEGDVVSGSAALESDIKYKFNNCPKAYLGIQITF